MPISPTSIPRSPTPPPNPSLPLHQGEVIEISSDDESNYTRPTVTRQRRHTAPASTHALSTQSRHCSKRSKMPPPDIIEISSDTEPRSNARVRRHTSSSSSAISGVTPRPKSPRTQAKTTSLKVQQSLLSFPVLGKQATTTRTTQKRSRDEDATERQGSKKPKNQSALHHCHLSNLGPEQRQAFRLAQAGTSFFLTGDAGTGKSHILREIIHALRQQYIQNPDAVAVTASTGIAAVNIGGVTIHSFAGIEKGDGTWHQICERVHFKHPSSVARWRNVRVLLLDEIGMINGPLLDLLSKLATSIRGSKDGNGFQPFGGIQVIGVGDFLQLPPVHDDDLPPDRRNFAFQAECWPKLFKTSVTLKKIWRQADPAFINILNEFRRGQLSDDSVRRIKELSRAPVKHGPCEPTELFATKVEVNTANNKRLKALPGTPVTYSAIDTGKWIHNRNPLAEVIQEHMAAPKELNLKVGCQVMLLKKIRDEMRQDLVNGTVGNVVGFSTLEQYGNTEGFNAVPGLSNMKDGEKVFPLVVFPDSSTREQQSPVLVTPQCFEYESPYAEDRDDRGLPSIVLRRKQLPLILAWSMTIHKSQGRTIRRIRINMSKVFTKGQAYAAISRAESLDGLQVINFERSMSQPHPTALAFHAKLENSEENQTSS